jgi:hypothetical protein
LQAQIPAGLSEAALLVVVVSMYAERDPPFLLTMTREPWDIF